MKGSHIASARGSCWQFNRSTAQPPKFLYEAWHLEAPQKGGRVKDGTGRTGVAAICGKRAIIATYPLLFLVLTFRALYSDAARSSGHVCI